MGIKLGEKVLVLTDVKTSTDAISILGATISDFGAVISVNRDLPLEFCEEMPEGFEPMMRGYDVIIFAASQSWYHTSARKRAKREWRKRVAECYGLVTESLLNGGLTADYNQVARKTEELLAIFKREKFFRVISEKGTDFTCRIMDVGFENGGYHLPASGGNLPAGEVYIRPLEGSVNGRVVFDVSMDLCGTLNEDTLTVDIKNGEIARVLGAKSLILQKVLHEDHRVAHIAEIAFGTNSWSKLGRSVLEDEKKLGTIHIGFGNDTYFGGKNKGPHYDGIFLSSKLIFDDRELILK